MYVLIDGVAIAGASVRYRDVVFNQIKIDSVEYSTQNGKPIYMDVYQPLGDAACQRLLIILAHGGSFMHGNRRSDCLPALSCEFAVRGFVAASIDTGSPTWRACSQAALTGAL